MRRILRIGASLALALAIVTCVDKTITGPNGKQATVDTTGTYGNGQFTKDKTITGPNGKQATVDTTGTYGNGQVTKNKTITLPNGKQVTEQSSGTGSKQP